MIEPLSDQDQNVKRHLAAVALIVTLAFVGLGFLIVHPEGLFNRHSDLLAFHLGNQTVLHDSWRLSHRLPLWRSDVLSGTPALTNPQSMYTHPLHLLFLLAPPERVVGLVIWLEMLVAALGAYYAGVVLRLSVPGRLVVAVATLFSYKTILAIYAGWLTPLSGIAAIPFLFAAAGAVGDRPSLRSALVLGAAGALSLLEMPPSEFSPAGVFDDQPGFRFYEGLTAGPVRLYRNRRPLGRAFFVSNVVQAANEDHEIALTFNADLRTAAVAMAPAHGGTSDAAPGDRVEVRQRSVGHLELAVRAANPRFLVVSEVWHPGWSVQVDGREAALAQTDIALQGLWVAAGEHTVVLDFWPPGLSAGLAISAITGAFVIALGGLAMFLSHRSTRSIRAGDAYS